MRIKWLLVMAVIAALIGTGVAFSQHPSQPSAPQPEKVISKREWNKMKQQWAKQTDKWASCNKEPMIRSSAAARAGRSSPAA